MAARSQNSFSWVDPRTGQRYWGDQAGAMMVAFMNGTIGPPKGLSGPAAPAPAPAPAAAPVARPNPLSNPWDYHEGDSSDTTAGITNTKSAYDSAIAQINSRQTEGMRRLGIKVGNDPVTGRTFALDLEGNPYSDAARIQRQFAEERDGSANTAGAQLFDSSFGHRMRDANNREGGARDELVNRGRDFYEGLEGQRGDAFNQAMDAVLGYRTGDAGRAAANVPLAPLPIPSAPSAPAANSAQGRYQASQSAAVAARDAAEFNAKRRARRRGR